MTTGDSVTIEFTYQATDGAPSNLSSNVATVTITVDGVNDTPVADNETATTDEDSPSADIDVLTGDTDAEMDPLSITEIDGMSITAGGPAVTLVTGDQVSLNLDGTLVYNPNGTFESLAEGGPDGSRTFSYTVSDGNTSSTGDVVVTIEGVNDAPTASNGSASVPEETLLTATLSGGDVDTGDTLTFAEVVGPSGRHADDHQRRDRCVHVPAECELRRKRLVHVQRHRQPWRPQHDGHFLYQCDERE